MEYRIEKDTLGEMKVPADKYWGAQTQRSKENFKIGTERMPLQVIRAFAQLKKAAATVNHDLGILSGTKKKGIIAACDEVINGVFDDHFPLVVWQTGSGTQSNMNINEVLARRANELLTTDETIHPNDDINMSQSSNDTFPTAMHIAAYHEIQNLLIPAIKQLKETFGKRNKILWRSLKLPNTFTGCHTINIRTRNQWLESNA